MDLLDFPIMLSSAIMIILFIGGGVLLFGKFNDTMDIVNGNSTQAGVEEAANIIENANTKLQVFEWASGILLIGMFLAILVGAVFVRSHPAIFIIYILFFPFLEIFAIILSNAYVDITTSSILAETYAGFTIPNFIFAYLPIWTGVFFVLGAVLMFIRMRGDANAI